MWGGEARVNKNVHKNFAGAAKTLTMTKFEVRGSATNFCWGPRIHWCYTFTLLAATKLQYMYDMFHIL